MTAREQAERDMTLENHEGGITLNMPSSVLFNAEEFFEHYRDHVVDRAREHRKYLVKRYGTLDKRKPIR